MHRVRLPAAFQSEPGISRSVLRAQRIFKPLRLWDNALDREAEEMVMRRLGEPETPVAPASQLQKHDYLTKRTSRSWSRPTKDLLLRNPRNRS